ncbi:hypothetical protein ILUMI_21100 [Ignelater luminosus]|uniref:Uncharacterized protein n=1 Tax=Ignelater luminosus TaxID=2038154 RepID=A0A8K0CJJ6_IGNLU|nr:hypothetical protein ILUMI_21100 [Ignelater luminosus]
MSLMLPLKKEMWMQMESHVLRSDSYQSDLCPELIEMRKTEFLNQLTEANRDKIEKVTQLQKESGLLKEGNRLLSLNLEEYANYEIRHLEVHQHNKSLF